MSSRTLAGLWDATEAISVFVLLEQSRPLYAGVAKHNAASIRVLQKCGFVHFEDDGATHILLKLDAKL